MKTAFVLLLVCLTPFFCGISIAEICECDAGDDCCCSCTYNGPGDGGGRLVCTISNNCETNQTAECSCGNSGCTRSCTTHANQGSLEPDDTVHKVDITDVTLTGICAWVAGLDRSWSCHVRSDPTPSLTVTKDYDEEGTFTEVIQTIAIDYEKCAEIDEETKTLTFRPEGTCI